MSVVRWNQNELGSTQEKELTGGPLPPTTLAAIESLAIPLVQEVVFLADFRCSGCQQRVAEIMTKMNGETQSVMINVLEKKVTLTCTYEVANKLPRGRLFPSVHRTSLRKVFLMMRPFLSFCT